MTVIQHFLERQVAADPQRRALVGKSGTFSFGELDRISNQIAQWLHAHSVLKGKRVLLLGANSIELVATIFGALKAGTAFVPVHPDTPMVKLAYILNDCRPAALVVDAPLYNRHAKLLNQQRLPVLLLPELRLADNASAEHRENVHIEQWTALDSYPDDKSGIEVTENDLAAVLYTSGSTKDPKGVMSLHRQVVFVTSVINSRLQNSAADVVLCGLPLSFDYGLYQVFLCAEVGATLILEPDFGFPPVVPRLLAMHHVTVLPSVPSFFALLLRSRLLERVKLPSLRYISSTGDIFPPAQIDRLREILPHVSVFSMYGLTECKRVSILAPDQLDSHRGSVGLPLPGTCIMVIDDTGVERASGVGQLVVRGPHVMMGYWNDPTETARRYGCDPETGERILWTGDRCRIDTDGYLYFLGRDEMLIKRRGHRISVAEVESFLCSLDGISEVGVVGIPDELEGEQIWAYVSALPEAQIRSDQMKELCLATLGTEVCPQWFIITRSPLPKTPNGKIDRLFLRQLTEIKGELGVEDLRGEEW